MADWTPQSRAEEILFDTINGEPYDGLPQSRIEELLLELKEVIEEGGGGGGGTTNYNQLQNLPQINGTTLKGNKTSSDLGLSSVVANPTGEAVGELSSISIDGDKYSIPESSEYEETTVWTGSKDMLTSFTVNITDPYTDYDALRFEYESGNVSHNFATHYEKLISKDTLATPEWFSLSDFYLANGAGVNTVGKFTDTTNLSVKLNSVNWFTSCTLTKIVGIKYGNGVSGGGGGAVTGVKGSAESSYRTGNVEISASNIGLGNVDNTADLNKPISTATQTALNGKVDTVVGKGLSTNDYDNTAKGIVDGVTSALAGKVDTSLVGSSNGVAELDANGRVPSSQLPSYVDDTIEGYLNSVDGKFYADSSYTTEITGETGKIYVTIDKNKTYRWSGSGFVEISESLALGETSSTAYAGNKGKANADAITAIKDGTNLDSFADVEDAFNYLTFEGTQAEWNLLSTAEKKKYKQAIFTDDYDDNPVGNLNALTTTDKSSCVGAINEVNGFFVNLGPITANDWTNFFKNACAAFHALNPKTYVVHNVFLSWGGTRYGGQFIDYGDAVDFTITGGGGGTLYCGYSMLAGVTKFFTYMSSDKTQTVVSLDSTYDAGTDWNILKQGNICVMNMRDLKDIPNGTTKIGTIPVGFRPELEFFEYVYSANKDVHLGFKFEDNGDITCLNQTGAAISGTVYANRNVTYFTA